MFILSRRFYSLILISLMILMLSISGFIIYQLMPTFKFNGGFFKNFSLSNPQIKILLSNQTINYLSNIGIDPNSYKQHILKLQKKLKQAHINSQIISEKELNKLNKNNILIAFDTYNLSSYAKKEIENFLENGGNLIFNYRFAYINEYNKFLGEKEIEKITHLQKKADTISKKDAPFYISKIISPLNQNQNDYRQDLIIYDPLPIFHSNYTPDLLMTNWEVSSTPILNNKHLSINDDGIAWHGFYGKGKWFYFSFPMYVFLDMNGNYFKKLFSDMINFFNNPITVIKYPFLDSPNAIFISEDTEYKYPYGLNFAKLAHKKHIPVTLFCVAKLAKKYENITKEISTFKNCEIGSHSYSHVKIMGTNSSIMQREIVYSKKLLEKITERKIYGFRPPREEIDKKMEDFINKAGYKYVMEKTKPYMLPKEEHKGFLTLPRHGTDDYIYLIETDWSKEKILKNIIRETNFLTSINAIYTLSVHTHLLSYKTNITILAQYFDYLNFHKNLYPQKGIDIINKFKLTKNIKITYSKNAYNIILTIQNNNKYHIKNFTFRIYYPNIEIKNIYPEIINYKVSIIKNNKERRYLDLRIDKIPPKTGLNIFIEYKNL